MYTIEITRIYEEPKKTDSFRILIDKLWPRGIKKEDAALDLWLKEIAASDSLRQWFNHDPKKWEEFQKRNAKELVHNNAVALRNIIFHGKYK